MLLAEAWMGDAQCDAHLRDADFLCHKGCWVRGSLSKGLGCVFLVFRGSNGCLSIKNKKGYTKEIADSRQFLSISEAEIARLKQPISDMQQDMKR